LFYQQNFEVISVCLQMIQHLVTAVEWGSLDYLLLAGWPFFFASSPYTKLDAGDSGIVVFYGIFSIKKLDMFRSGIFSMFLENTI
ncbi:hypothetical protein ACJX0J_015114, partial [Zea mays]